MSPSSSNSHDLEPTVSDQSLSVARRLMRGQGRASMLAYRMDPAQSVQSMAHGVDAKGRFLVSWIGNACCPVPESAEVNPVRTGGQPEPVPVRLEILRQSPDPMTRIAAASLHLLGSLYVLSDDERIDLLAERALPTMVGDVAGMRGAHVGVLVSDRVLLHDCYGVTPLSFDALVGESADAAPVFPTMADDLEAFECVACLAEPTLRHVCDSVMCGLLRGRVHSTKAVVNPCPAVADKVFCVDVDQTGILFMRVLNGRATSVVADFSRNVHSLEGLDAEVSALVESSTLVDDYRV
ncbi:hypothetical protein [Propionibacterium freudenreichii]|uniref:Uncharacterized protein n=1 Tax=Propionibacterium freudenreichii subsp. shermanii (strain ATCC 9614 / DSM 4902 / CIP 103027 / NCIMB 8099 / CIRM-BIA1) TaxID=754252 RepID=D7GHE6_PROFC|nr:hypothetical protein [Propionibacterium freudenreichii]MCQ1997958.1 hypothetical protein [Propionibacterium freudenreichii]MDK9296542.1 hypothetical protein [Propionibacterium freudenreichii]CBL55518.1 Hypothetical protein PFREUD_00170 [Propionibacterium freudenreichii subsp. shermanii CIRM-BIA1]